MTTFGISSPFGLLSPSLRQVVYALLTRLPLASFQHSVLNVLVKHFIKVKLRLRRNDARSYFIKYSVLKICSFDLHVLSTPPAFVLSQDQTLHKIYEELNQALNYLLKKLPIAMLFIPIDVLIRSFHFSNIWL